MSYEKKRIPDCRNDAAAVTADPDKACDKCGAFGAYVWDGVNLCLQCYTEQGSCCAESEEPDAEPPPAQ